MMRVTKIFEFDSAHRLNSSHLSEQENVDIFHACNNFHGHTYKLYVTVEGNPDTVTGFVIDFKELKKKVQENVIDRFDHKVINEVPPFSYHDALTTTCENMIRFIYYWLRVDAELNVVQLRLYETPTSYAEFSRADDPEWGTWCKYWLSSRS
jgi:6-pyruvoyltetrahydropterin/6-carboxytetrahydropterin synthase